MKTTQGWCWLSAVALSLTACSSAHERPNSGAESSDASLDAYAMPDSSHDWRDASVDAQVSPSQTLLACDIPEPCAGQNTRWYSGENNAIESGMACVMRGLARGTPGRYVVSHQLLSAGPTPTTTYVLIVGHYMGNYEVTYTDGTDQTWRCSIASTSNLETCATSLDAGTPLECARGPLPWVTNCQLVTPICPVFVDAGIPDAGNQCHMIQDSGLPTAYDQLLECETPEPCPMVNAGSVEGTPFVPTNVECTLAALRDRVPGTYRQQRYDADTGGSSTMDQVIIVHADGTATYARKRNEQTVQRCDTATPALDCTLKPADYFDQCLAPFQTDPQAATNTGCVLNGISDASEWLEGCIETPPICE